MYLVGTAIEVRAFHVMPGMEGPEGELHSHDYKVEVAVERDELDNKGMVCDLDLLDAALADLADTVRDEDLEKIRPEEAEAVTVEVFARWAHRTLVPAVAKGGGQRLTVRVWESPEAYGGYAAPVS
jgi:6-pyruvoyl-tetrahydropterin synthase